MSFDSSFFPESTFLTSQRIFFLDEQIDADLISDSVPSARHPLALNPLEPESATFTSSVGFETDTSASETDALASETDALAAEALYATSVYSSGADTDLITGLSYADVAVSAQDGAEDARASARDIGVLRGWRTVRDSINRTDHEDYYKFTLTTRREVTLALAELNSNANLRLLDHKGDIIKASQKGGVRSEYIKRTLDAGDYFVQVVSHHRYVDTGYRLRLSEAAVGFSRPDRAGNSRASAQDFGVLDQLRQRRDFVGRNDRKDFYRFSLSETSKFSLLLNGLSENADVRLTDSSGSTIETSTAKGTGAERIERTLAAGDYFVEVLSHEQSNTDYMIQLSATPTDGAGNTPESALDIGNLSGDRTFRDFIGGEDSNDYYRFNLEYNSSFELSLSELGADVDVKLLDSSGQVIESSTHSGSSTETIERLLSAGRYYVRVYPYSGSTDYTINLSATEVDDLAGNTFSQAKDIGNLSGSRSFQDIVGTTDTNDYYRFTLNRRSNFRLTIDGLNADADVELLRSDRSVLHSSLNSNSTDELITQTLEVGTYYVRVYSFSGTTSYNLTLSTTAIRSNDDTGNTIDRARNIGLLDSTRTFQESIGGTADHNDYYRFRIDQESGFELLLTGLSTDVDVELLDSDGYSLISSTASDTSDEAINTSISPGIYYVRVYPYDINQQSNYQLTFSATELAAGFDITYGYGLVNASASVAAALGRNMPFAEADELDGLNWGLDLVDAQDVWEQGYSGDGVVIAVVDTGVDYLHDDISSNLWLNTNEIADNGIDDDGNGYIDDATGWDFSDQDNNPYDEDGHGTHVAAIAAGVSSNGGITGVAYEAQIMAVRALDADGSGSNQDIADGIRYAADNGADVINLSFGSDSYSSSIRSAIQYATSQGSFVVSASGNDSADRPFFPGRYATDYGVVVGAVDQYKTAAYFSNGAGSDSNMHYVVAPGYDIYSATPGNSYGYKNGTSMAAPYVAGIVALMLDANPNLTHAQIRQILIDSASRLS